MRIFIASTALVISLLAGEVQAQYMSPQQMWSWQMNMATPPYARQQQWQQQQDYIQSQWEYQAAQRAAGEARWNRWAKENPAAAMRMVLEEDRRYRSDDRRYQSNRVITNGFDDDYLKQYKVERSGYDTYRIRPAHPGPNTIR